MKAIADPTNALARGLADIRAQFKAPVAFSPEVLQAADKAAQRAPSEHADRTNVPFVTLDPATSTDLDQAFYVEAAGGDLLLRYAIADVAWFVADGDAIDQEAWRRGATLYLPDGKASLYPEVLSQDAASLLPSGPRPAVVFTVRVAGDGAVKLDGAERAVIRSKAKLAYDSVRAADLPTGFVELAQRVFAAEDARGASRVDPPEQEVQAHGDGSYHLAFRPKLESEVRNSALSLAANMAIADALFEHRTGLFRVMAEADKREVAELRNAAKALGLDWPPNMSLVDYRRTLDPADAKQAAFMLAIRRASAGASYEPYKEGVKPWHAAVSARYAHATAPLRRLADRYVIMATLAVANGKPVPQAVTDAFQKLPRVMSRADGRASQMNRAVIDLAEAVMLQGREGEVFQAVVTDVSERGARLQLSDLPIVTPMAAGGLEPGDKVAARLVSADPATRKIEFERAK